MSLAEELLEWAEEELEHGSPAHREQVARILAQLREFPDPESLPVGSTQRFLAQRRVDRLAERAEALGFETPGKALKKEIGKQIAGRALGIDL
jgi:protoheme ferro-lyase